MLEKLYAVLKSRDLKLPGRTVLTLYFTICAIVFAVLAAGSAGYAEAFDYDNPYDIWLARFFAAMFLVSVYLGFTQ